MNILVVGNGFDLAHDLPTRYTDFLIFVDEVNAVFNNNKCIFKLSRQLKGYDSQCKRFSEMQDYIHEPNNYEILNNRIYRKSNKNIWYKYFIYVLKYYSLGENWIDFESEISQIIEYLYKFYYDNKAVKFSKRLDFIMPKAANIMPKAAKFLKLYFSNHKVPYSDFALMESYIKSSGVFKYLSNDSLEIFIKSSKQDFDNLISCLNFYLDLVNNMKPTVYSPDIVSSHIDAVLSFNYTSTFTKYYNNTTNIHHVHGKVGADDTSHSIVLGINEFLFSNELNNQSGFIFYKKFFQRMLYDTGFEYKNWLKENSNNIFVFGHSLDKTDRDILDELINNEHTNLTTIYYHNKEQNSQQIENLHNLLGHDRLLRYVNSNPPKIKFQQQQPMRPISEMPKPEEQQ